jgi:hypothetical protein
VAGRRCYSGALRAQTVTASLSKLIPNPVFTLSSAFTRNSSGHTTKAGLLFLRSRFDVPALGKNTNGTACFANDAQNAFKRQ